MAKNDTQVAIIETAKELFFKHGFKRVSVGDICRKVGITRKTYYDYFGSKDEIVRFLMDSYMDETTQKYLGVMKQKIPFPEKLRAIIDMKMEAVRSFSMEFMEDLLSPRSKEMRGYFEQKIEQNRELIYAFYTNSQRRGEIRNDIPVAVIIEMQNHLLNLCRNNEFRSNFKDVPTMLKQVSEMYLFGIIKDKKE